MSANTRASKNNTRKAGGTFTVLVVFLALLVLLPLALIGFELSRANLAQKQLRVATDAAALSGSLVMVEGGNLETAKQAALAMFRKNNCAGTELENAQATEGIEGAQPARGECLFELVWDESKKQVMAMARLGFSPLFAQYLGIGSVPLDASSKAGGRPDGKTDMVIVFDTSYSMGAKGHGQPLADAKTAVMQFVNKLAESGDVHFGLVAYANDVAGHQGAPKRLPLVELSTSADMHVEVVDGVGSLTLGGSTPGKTKQPPVGTITPNAMERGLTMLQGPGHRPDATAMLLLISDGLPNRVYRVRPNGKERPQKNIPAAHRESYAFGRKVADLTGTQAVTLYSIGFFHQSSTRIKGREFMKRLKESAGSESQTYTANTIEEFEQALSMIPAIGTRLVN